MFRRLAPAIGLVAGLVPGLALAQTNIDAGKSPAEIFASDCATCHKTTRGLAAGQNSLMLTGFLVEHYTASRDQAAALAAYVMGAGGAERVPAAQGRGPKAAPDHATTATEEPKGPAHSPGEPAKPAEAGPAGTRLRPPGGEENKRLGAVPSTGQEPAGHRPTGTGHLLQPATATREHPKEPESQATPQEPVVAEPASAPAPAQLASPAAPPGSSAAAPAATDSGESPPVPRDDIPD